MDIFDIAAAAAITKGSGGGSGGTDNYNALSNKPKVNGVTLTGDKTLEQLNIEALTAEEVSAMWNN